MSSRHFIFFPLNFFFFYSCPISPPLFLSTLHTPLPPTFPTFNSCPWVKHTSSLASPFPMLFLTFPCLFCTYHLCFLFPVSFPPLFPHPLPAGNPPCDFHFCDSVPVLVVSFWFFFFVQLLTVVSLWSFYCSKF